MSWRDGLQPASFRNIPFFVEAHEAAGGRNGVVFQYPHGSVYVEDLGAGVKRFGIDAYVLGDDYFTKRDQLLAVLQDDAGPGTLVHPYLGTKTAAVQRWTLTESRRDGRMATFAIEFIETLAAPASPAGGFSLQSIESSADGAVASMGNNFLETFKTGLPVPNAFGVSFATPGFPVPGFSLQSVSQILVDWTGTIRRVMSPVITTTQALASMKSQLDEIIRESGTLVRTPTRLLTQLGAVMTSMLDWPDTPRLGIGALIQAFSFSTTAVRPIGSTQTRLIEQSNQDAITALLKGVTVVACARMAVAAISAPGRTISTARRAAQVDPPAGYDSYQDAIAVRSLVVNAIDGLSDTASDEVFAALQQVRADLSIAVPGTPNTLPQLVGYTPLVTVPALVLSQRLYGNVSFVDDLVTRNGVQHPGFVPGSVALEVLSDV